MDEETIKWLLTDTSMDPVSNVPISAVVFMLYYGLELKHFLLKISDNIIADTDPEIRDFGETSLYLAGSASQGFYLNTNDFLDARDIDIVSICKKDVRKECEFDNKYSDTEKTNDVYVDALHKQCKGVLKDNSTVESSPFYFNVETWDDTYPGYVMLRKCRKTELPIQTSLSHRYMSSLETTKSRTQYWNDMQPVLADIFRAGLDDEWGTDSLVYDDVLAQGPSASLTFTNIYLDIQLNTDLVFALPYPDWPEIANDWRNRQPASGWPSPQVKEEILATGCLVVPKGQKGSRVEEYEWRISFSLAELKLSRTLSRVQREIIHVLKALLSNKDESGYVNVEAKLDSYFILNLLYAESEKIKTDEWTEVSIAKLIFHLLDQLAASIGIRCLPHYFIPENNLLHKLTFPYVKLGKGEFMRGYFEEDDMMDTDEYVDFALYAVLRLRYDPLGQILLQSKYVQLSGPIRRAVFEPLVNQVKSSSKVEVNMYFMTIMRLLKAHLYHMRFEEAYLYAEDALKFYRLAGKTEELEKSVSGLQIIRAVCAYFAGNHNIAMEIFEETERAQSKCTLLEKHQETFLAIFARTLSIFEAKPSVGLSEGMLSRSQIILEKAILLSDSNPTVIMELVNYFMVRGCYSEAGEQLNIIKCDPVVGCNRNVKPTDNLDESTAAIVEEPIAVHAEYSAIQSTTDVQSMDTERHDTGESLHRRDGIKHFDDQISNEIGNLKKNLENPTEATLNDEDDEEMEEVEEREKEEKDERVPSGRPLLNRNDNHDLINLYGLWQSFTKLNLKDHAKRVFQKLSKTVNERQRIDKTVTFAGLDHDFRLYSSFKEEPSLADDWEDPFALFKERVIFTKADDHLLDDVLKAVVGQCGVVSLTVDDLYFHYRAQLLKRDGKPAEALSVIEHIQNHYLIGNHYKIIGEKEKADDAVHHAALEREGAVTSVSETLQQWIEKLLEAARKYEPRNDYIDSVFS